MRGDRPLLEPKLLRFFVFTPHARGSTFWDELVAIQGKVYPACAGIDRPRHQSLLQICSLPRMRGDRPAHLPCLPAP